MSYIKGTMEDVEFIIQVAEDGTIKLPLPVRVNMGVEVGNLLKLHVKNGKITLEK